MELNCTLNTTSGNGELSATLSGAESLSAQLESVTDSGQLTAELSENGFAEASLVPMNNSLQLNATLEMGNSSSEPDYEGSYTVTPKFIEQTLETKNRTLKENVTVEAIVVDTQEKTVAPTFASQEVVPDTGKYLAKVTVSPISVTYEQNDGGGMTVTIG